MNTTDSPHPPRVTVAIPTYNRSTWLQRAVTSALTQTYPHLRVLIGDNASTDDTEAVVAGMSDDRIEYVRHPENLGQQENFNWLLANVTTEYVVIVPDDDELYPGYLQATVEALDANPSVGFVDTAFDGVDRDGNVLFDSHHRFGEVDTFRLEGRRDFRRRVMHDAWPTCLCASLMRTEAAAGAAPFRSEDFPADDIGLFLRMSDAWDVAHLGASLAAFRIHDASTTAEHALFTERGYEQPDSHFATILQIRLRSIAELHVSERERKQLRRVAWASHRRALVTNRALTVSDTRRRFSGLRSILHLAADDPRILLTPRAWQLIVADLGGRQLKRVVRVTGVKTWLTSR